VYYENEGEIYIHYSSNKNLRLNIDEEGYLKLLCGAGAGSFTSENTVSLNYATNSCPGGGLGGGTNYKVDGTKQ
jgi:hypothetical protein